MHNAAYLELGLLVMHITRHTSSYRSSSNAYNAAYLEQILRVLEGEDDELVALVG